MSALAASTWDRMFGPRAVRFPADRQLCVHIPLPVSLVMAALYFCRAALPFAGSFSSHTFSSKSLPAKKLSAILMWHLIAAATSLPSSLPTASAHWSLGFAETGVVVVSTVPASSPPAPAGSIGVLVPEVSQ